MNNILPSVQEPFLDNTGRVSPIWYRFLETLLAANPAAYAFTFDEMQKNMVASGLMEKKPDE